MTKRRTYKKGERPEVGEVVSIPRPGTEHVLEVTVDMHLSAMFRGTDESGMAWLTRYDGEWEYAESRD